jgi:hypothetical protein
MSQSTPLLPPLPNLPLLLPIVRLPSPAAPSLKTTCLPPAPFLSPRRRRSHESLRGNPSSLNDPQMGRSWTRETSSSSPKLASVHLLEHGNSSPPRTSVSSSSPPRLHLRRATCAPPPLLASPTTTTTGTTPTTTQKTSGSPKVCGNADLKEEQMSWTDTLLCSSSSDSVCSCFTLLSVS